MIDIRYLRSEPDTVRELMARRNKPELIGLLDEALGFDGRMREITAERDAIRQQVNELSKQVGTLRRNGNRSGESRSQGPLRCAAHDTNSAFAARRNPNRHSECALQTVRLAVDLRTSCKGPHCYLFLNKDDE